MTSTQQTSVGIIFARFFWMMVGPLILVMLFFVIVNVGMSWWTVADLAFGVLAGVILTRWLEFLAGNPQTATGEVATPAHLRRFVIVTLSLGVGGWVIANVLGNHVLNK